METQIEIVMLPQVDKVVEIVGLAHTMNLFWKFHELVTRYEIYINRWMQILLYINAHLYVEAWLQNPRDNNTWF